MPSSMDGVCGAGAGDDCAAMLTMSFHDLERPSAVLVPRLNGSSGGTQTDKNGNNLPPFSYSDLKGMPTSHDNWH